MLNVTGGGIKNIKRSLNPRPVYPDLTVSRDIIEHENDIDGICEKIGQYKN